MIIGFEQLNAEQKQIIDEYSKSTYGPINHHLRENTILEWDFLNIEGRTKTLDSIFSISPMRPNPPLIFQGTQNDSIYGNPVFNVQQYMSTTIEENISHKFIPDGKGTLLKIHLLCSNINLLEIESQFHEFEYLIPRNTRFRVLYRGGEIKTVKNQTVSCIGICPF